MTALLLYLLLQLGISTTSEDVQNDTKNDKTSTEQTFSTRGGTGNWTD